MSIPFYFGRVRKLRMEKDTSPALVLAIAERVVDNMLQYTIQITKQKYRGDEFNYGSNSFTASNGFILASVGSPACDAANTDFGHNDYHMYLRGSSRNSDNDIITIRSLGWIERLKVAVKEYNEHVTL